MIVAVVVGVVLLVVTVADVASKRTCWATRAAARCASGKRALRDEERSRGNQPAEAQRSALQLIP